MRYVTFNPETGKLTGCYSQDLHPDHADAYVVIDDEAGAQWTSFHAVEQQIEIGEDENGDPVYADGWVLELLPPAPPVPEPVPQAVSMRQARLALLGAGLLDTVNSTIAAMPGADGVAARIEWEFSSEVKRNQPLVQAMAPMLGLTEEQLDELFIAAAAL